jgi:signal peptidase II
MKLNSDWRIGFVALTVFVLDQLAKQVVRSYLAFDEERVLMPGFFKLVHWRNTGAAWSFFRGHNVELTIIGLAAIFVLFLTRHHFDIHTRGGQVSLGLIFGGILGNLTDRLLRNHVTDFLYFYVNPRGGEEIGFPAFNVADSAICVGVGLLLLLSWQSESRDAPAVEPKA